MAEILRSPDPRYDALRRDEKVAGELIALVEADTKHPLAGGNNQGDRQRIERRMFLCRALGAFTIPDAAPLLARLANEERDPMEVEVRLAALEGLATLARNVGPEELRKDDKVVQAVLEASRSVESNTVPQAADKESAYR
ncbi:hypothetical protein, partial [Bradyrhizobium sp. NBAIM08]|uniref:hypothetical protein n=1 Tax=Bradyrhizobium sp. NBAIM08 TaxID=2793815 RepID=UPI001CD2EB0A